MVRGLRIFLKNNREKIMNDFLPEPPLRDVDFARTLEIWSGQLFASWAYKREFVADQKLLFEPYIGHDDKAFLLCALAHSDRLTIGTVPLVKYRHHRGSLQGRRNLKEMFHDMQAHASMMRCLEETGNRKILEYRFPSWDFPAVAGACAWAATKGSRAERERFQVAAKDILNRPGIRKQVNDDELRAMRTSSRKAKNPMSANFCGGIAIA